MLSRITGHSTHEEVSSKTRTFDLLTVIRDRRLKCVGHILRMDPQRLVHKAVQHMHTTRIALVKRHYITTRNNEYIITYNKGDLLMDVSTKFSWEELNQLAANRRKRRPAYRN